MGHTLKVPVTESVRAYTYNLNVTWVLLQSEQHAMFTRLSRNRTLLTSDPLVDRHRECYMQGAHERHTQTWREMRYGDPLKWKYVLCVPPTQRLAVPLPAEPQEAKGKKIAIKAPLAIESIVLH